MGDAGASLNDTANTAANAVNTASAAAGGAASAGVAAVAAAGDALVASITNMLNSVFANIDQAISRTKNWNEQTHHHHSDGGDRYVTGDTNWDTYDLPTLVSMVAAPASPSQVQSVAGLWRTNGSSITQGADNLSQSLTTLMNYWQGAAAQQVSASVANTAGWITAVGETAGKVADQVENASGALQSAQNTMPGAPTSTFWTAYNTAAGGATAGAAGGPFGVAAGTMMGSLASVFVANNNTGTEKQQAVQTMQRFEQAGVSIDTTTPTFTAPPVWGSAGGSSSGGNGNSGLTVTAPQPQGQTTGVNLSTVPSFANSPTGRWDGLTGGPGAGGVGDTGAQGGSFAGFGMFGGGGGFGKGGETQRASVPTIQPTNAPAGAGAAAGAGENPAGIVGRTTDSAAMGSSVMEEVDARAAAGGGAMGSPMGMGAGMMGGRGAGGNEEEFRRRIPYEEDPFITGLKAVPPVIGLSSMDREADQ